MRELQEEIQRLYRKVGARACNVWRAASSIRISQSHQTSVVNIHSWMKQALYATFKDATVTATDIECAQALNLPNAYFANNLRGWNKTWCHPMPAFCFGFQLIDFECGGYNFKGFDVASHSMNMWHWYSRLQLGAYSTTATGLFVNGIVKWNVSRGNFGAGITHFKLCCFFHSSIQSK